MDTFYKPGGNLELLFAQEKLKEMGLNTFSWLDALTTGTEL